MIEEMSKDFHNKLYHLPPNAKDFQEFGEKVLNAFIEELKRNSMGVAWNSGFDGVVFTSKNLGSLKSLDKVTEEFLGQKSNSSDSTVSQGAGTSAGDVGHQEAGESDQLP